MGAEIDARDDIAWTPLDYAAKNGFYKSMQILLENDAPVDARDKNNNTPLHWAAACGHVHCVSMLLDYGADISLKNIDRKNCLDLAVDNFHQETCMGLVTHARLVPGFLCLPRVLVYLNCSIVIFVDSERESLMNLLSFQIFFYFEHSSLPSNTLILERTWRP